MLEMCEIRLEKLKEAVIDMRFLLNRGYHRKTAADYITSRYQLNEKERAIIYRAVYSIKKSEDTLRKILKPEEIKDKVLSIDGFNNIITIENALKGNVLIKCDDGLIRDVSYTSRKFKFSENTNKALNMIFETLKIYKPSKIHFFFDKQISFSGEIASMVRLKMRDENIIGDAQTSSRNDKTIILLGEIIASSDSLIIEKAKNIFDLAGNIIKSRYNHLILDITTFNDNNGPAGI